MVLKNKVLQVFSARTWRLLAFAFALLIAPVFGFVQLADEVRENETLMYDEQVLQWINSYSTPWLDAFMAGLTELGGFIGVLLITAGIVAVAWRRGWRQGALMVAIGVSGAALLNILLKAFFQRDRPELWERIVTENSYSFPSGHAMASSALAISLILLLWPTKWRWLVTGLSLAFMGLIAFTRMYLGVHYPTDILAGWLVSMAWVAAVFAIVRHRRRIARLFR